MTDRRPSSAGIPLPAGDGDPAVVMELLAELNTTGPSALIARMLGALSRATAVTGLRLLIVNLEETHLEVRETLTAGTVATGEPIPLDATPHGEAYRTGEVRAFPRPESTVVAPVSAGKSREGVLEARLSRPATAGEVATIASVANLAGYLITAADRWTDEFHLTRRTKPMALAAEIQWGLLPLSAFSSSDIAVAGALEPAYDVGGDAFDYACGTEDLFGGVFDAMGHGLRAARLSGFAMAVYRNARRAGADLASQGRALHEALIGTFPHEGYVTGTLVQIDLAAPERSRIVRAGHPPPLVHRGSGPAQAIEVDGSLPFGVPFANAVRPQPLALSSGDRLVLYSDGVTEARPDAGELFGPSRLARALHEVRGLAPREAARDVIRRVRSHRGSELTDDATLLVIDIP